MWAAGVVKGDNYSRSSERLLSELIFYEPKQKKPPTGFL
jgi:hypothetical protein